MKSSKNLFIILIVISLSFLLISGCGQQPTDEIDRDDLNVGMVFEPGNLDPAQSWNGWFVVQSGMGQTLFRLDDNMEVETWLAKDYRQIDELNWEIELPTGVDFHDGQPMDAEAVKNSLKRSLEVNERAPDLLKIDSIDILAEDKLLITTKEPNPALINSLADPLTTIVNADLAAELGEQFAEEPSLTGPYQLANYQPDVEIVVDRNDDYWGQTPQLKEINFRFISDGMSRVMAFQSGEIDIAQNIPTANVDNLKQTSGLDVLSTSSLRVHMAYFNLEHQHLDSLEVRRAIAKAIDRKSLAEQVMDGGAVAGVGPFPLALPFGGDELDAYEHNLDKAADILTVAGWDLGEDGVRQKNGQKLKLTLHTYDDRPELPMIAETMQAQLKELGIEIQVKSVENISSILDEGNFDLAIYSMNTAPTGDPQYFLDLVFKSGASSNFSNFSETEVDQIISQLANTFEVQEQQRLAHQAQERILEKNPNLFLVYPKVNMGVKEGLTGYQVHPSEFYIIDETINWE
ncbi:ABC transporter substrate-binding protein [Fuchsiella alkaliacetigena]|uniref:ABC transporter substrate-binding protein n=1 Tax=Fuchsiella alkaliacetigena TaxID=957042 RepID=UPI00200A09F7|nr:ABC transporter substrate-binding protein [Fuchsiella alkaliacetigena]MCK8825590.1 ABC transporter substrate-binding protein [Fuchsiella alkaliacetigena]